MEILYNELSEYPLSESKITANQKVATFIKCYAESVRHSFNRIRFSKNFNEINLADGYTLQNWLEETDQKNNKDLLLGARTYPFINEDDVWAEDNYIRNDFFYENNEPKVEKTACLGLAAASIYDTLAISFSGSQLWEKNAITIIIVNGENENSLDVTNVFSKNCFNTNEIKNFIERIGELALIESLLRPEGKQIKLRDDHGKDILDTFAKRLRNSPYVNGIINSIPYNARATNFIRRVYPNGQIEIVLFWTDRGLGMIIQTTGRNQRETEEIARILEEEYAN